MAIIGGGIVGTATAAYLAEAGQSVILFEQSELAAGASGRNSGALQHPFDPLLAGLHQDSIALYGELAAIEPRFQLARSPAGLLLAGFDEAGLARSASDIAARLPELGPELLPPDAARALEPSLAEDVAAVRLATGYPVVPAAATLAFARRATRSGATLRLGEAAQPLVHGDAVAGVTLAGGEEVAARSVLVAAGPWSPALLDGWRADPPIRRTWGVVASVRLRRAPRHIIEQHDIDPGGSAEPAAFSLVTAGGSSSVGSTFLADEPAAEDWAPRLLAAGAIFVPALTGANLLGVRACARPVAFDGRPLIGALPVRGLYVCAGHGPWGISTGPASARLIADEVIGGAATSAVPPPLAASRWSWLT